MSVIWILDDWPLALMPKKKVLTEQEARALIVKEARYRLGCEDFVPPFTLRRAEPNMSWRWPRANWDATPDDAERWPPDCAQAFREAVTRNRGKYDIDWRHYG